jgi:hypothetical protein
MEPGNLARREWGNRRRSHPTAATRVIVTLRISSGVMVVSEGMVNVSLTYDFAPATPVSVY